MADPELSVIVEFDNVASAGTDHARAMLAELAGQVQELGNAAEILLFHDEDEVPTAVVQSLAEESRLAEAGEVEVHHAGGLRYYELKNAGVDRARGRLCVFVDSDVRPEKGWLRALVRPFEDPNVQFVAGLTYLGPLHDVYAKSFALFWNFPLRSDGGPPVATATFFANNFAARRSLLGRYPFPSDDRYRRQCSTLAERLTRDGVTIWRQPAARVMHPPPRGFMLRRGLVKGRDLFLEAKATGDPRRVGLLASLRIYGSYVKQSRRRILIGRRQVGLSRVGVAAAMALAASYGGAMWVGFLAARFSRVTKPVEVSR